MHINGIYGISFDGAGLAADVVRLNVTQYLQAGANVVQYNPLGQEVSATVLVIVQ